MHSFRQFRDALRPVLGGLCVIAAALAGAAPATRASAEEMASPFMLTLQPIEGALLELLSPAGKESKWRLDREASRGLDHVDVVDVGEQPKRVAAPAPDASPKERITGLFGAPKVWGWGIRARSIGHASIVLAPEPAAEGNRKLIEVDVVGETQDAVLNLPLQEGERVLLEILTNASTGAQWRINASESTGLANVKVQPGRTYDPRDPTDWRGRKIVGAPQLQEWEIEPIAPGIAHVALSYGQPWEEQKVFRRLSINAAITPPR